MYDVLDDDQEWLIGRGSLAKAEKNHKE
jgi:hypothetical protein